MLRTPKEMEQVWCPESRVLAVGASCHKDNVEAVGGVNRGDGYLDPDASLLPFVGNRCISTRCAQWRWGEPLEDRSFRVHGTNMRAIEEPPRPNRIPADWEWHPYVRDKDEPAGWCEPAAESEKRRRGYCGLGGRPEYDI